VSKGPRVMVLGPPSSGKTAVVKNLVNMALGSGMGWNMGVIGLDPSSVGWRAPDSAEITSHQISSPARFRSPPRPIRSQPTILRNRSARLQVPLQRIRCLAMLARWGGGMAIWSRARRAWICGCG
jgi:polyribonucleotide 5'-hydroxyl-kinase